MALGRNLNDVKTAPVAGAAANPVVSKSPRRADMPVVESVPTSAKTPKGDLAKIDAGAKTAGAMLDKAGKRMMAAQSSSKPAASEGSFGSAFAAARKSGKDVFTWNGKSYNTMTKEEAVAKATPKKPAATAVAKADAPVAPKAKQKFNSPVAASAPAAAKMKGAEKAKVAVKAVDKSYDAPENIYGVKPGTGIVGAIEKAKALRNGGVSPKGPVDALAGAVSSGVDALRKDWKGRVDKANATKPSVAAKSKASATPASTAPARKGASRVQSELARRPSDAARMKDYAYSAAKRKMDKEI